jgi:hypothetical protein
MVLQFSFADGYRRLKNAVLRHQLTILRRRLQGRVRRKSFKHVAVKKAQSALAKLAQLEQNRPYASGKSTG